MSISQAAGVIPIAHASGGPLKDIIVPFNGENTGWLPGVLLDAFRSLLTAFVTSIGFHARTAQEFAEAMHAALTLSPEDEHAIRWRARAWAVQRFSEEEFERGWNQSGWRRFVGAELPVQ